MPRSYRPALRSLLVLGVLGLACDQPARAPTSETKVETETKTETKTEIKAVSPDPTTPPVPQTPPSPPASAAVDGLELTSFALETKKEHPWVAVAAKVKLARDGREFETLDFKAACRIGDAIHIEKRQRYLGGEKQDTTIEFVDRMFFEHMYGEAPPPDTCDFWLSSRTRGLHDRGRYQEQLLAARCLRGGMLLDHDCAPLPPPAADTPLTAASLGIALTRPELEPEKEGYELDFLVELTSNEAVGPLWILEADFECQVDGKPVLSRNTLLAAALHELSPAQKTRNTAGPTEPLAAPPSQCEIVITGTARKEDPRVPMSTWCYRASEPLREGACPTAGG